MKSVWVAFSGVALAALAVPSLAQDEVIEEVSVEPEPDYPKPPAIIAERIEGDRFEPGNFEYLRGYFPEATPEEKAAYGEIIAWLDQCGEEGTLRLGAEMALLDLTLHEEFTLTGAANMCGQVTRGERFEDFASYEELLEATRGARLVFNTLRESIARAEERTGPIETGDLGGELHHRTLGEQMLRLAFHWGWQEDDNPSLPQMNEGERTVFLALLNAETTRVDHLNTQWLKGIVDEQGWPTITMVGKRGASAAWLLTQHADMDPAFQYRALQLMEPLVAEGEVSKGSYAYLYDRIMLKLVGTQRYATQVMCEEGDYVPRPLEDPERMEEYREEMELVPFSEYRTWFPETC